MRKIGNISINYDYYTGKDLYSDGSIEDELLEAYKNGTTEELLYTSNDYAILYHLSTIRQNIIEWYEFNEDAEVLEIGSGCGAITGVLSDKAKYVTCVELSEKRSLINAYRNKNRDNIEIILGNFQDIESDLKQYDIVTLIGVWEYSESYINCENPFESMLEIAKKHLKPNGKIIIAIENRMGLKYWNGAQEDHLGKRYAGLNDYVDAGTRKERTFSRQDIEKMFKNVGIEKYFFYYPSPDYKFPTEIYSDTYLPLPGNLRTFKKEYAYHRVYNFNEAIVNDQICSDGMFDYFSNSFLIVCGDEQAEIEYVKYNRERKKEFRIATYIKKTDNTRIVRKKALTQEGQAHISNMKKNLDLLKKANDLNFWADGELIQNDFICEFVAGNNVDSYLYIYRNDLNLLIQKIKAIIDIVFTPNLKDMKDFEMTDEFKNVFGECLLENEKSLSVTNVDMIFSNMKVEDGKITVFDSEWVFDFPIPYNYVKWRAIKEFYVQYYAYLKNKIEKNDFVKQFNITQEQICVFQDMEHRLSQYVHGVKNKEKYTNNYKKLAIMNEFKMY